MARQIPDHTAKTKLESDDLLLVRDTGDNTDYKWDISGGIVIGSPTGGAKGVDTLNIKQLYDGGDRVAKKTNLDSHTGNTSNPHSVTKAQVGLGSVPNEDATDMANWNQKGASANQVPVWGGAAWAPGSVSPIVHRSAITTIVSCTGIIPQDGTIPQDTEGTSVMAFTPTGGLSLSGYIRVQAIVYNARAVNEAGAVALFTDDLTTGTSNALAVELVPFPTLSVSIPGVILDAWIDPADIDTGNSTFTVRAGPENRDTGDEETIIGADDGAGGNVFGASTTCEIVVTEYPSASVGDIS